MLPFKTVAEKYSFSNVSIISVHWRKDILQWQHQKNTEWLTVHTCTNQEERRHDKTPAHKINVQSLMASVGEPQAVDSLILVDHGFKINEAYYRNVMLLQQFLITVR